MIRKQLDESKKMRIELVSTDLTGSIISLEHLPVTVGRSWDAEVFLSDPYVSRRHCRIDQIDGTLVVRDLGSKNGTAVNGLYVVEAHLMSGDKLTVGQTKFRAHYDHNRGRMNRKQEENH